MGRNTKLREPSLAVSTVPRCQLTCLQLQLSYGGFMIIGRILNALCVRTTPASETCILNGKLEDKHVPLVQSAAAASDLPSRGEYNGTRWEQPARRTTETAKDLASELPSSHPAAAIFNDRSRGMIEAKKQKKSRSLKIKKHLFLDSTFKMRE